MTSAEGLPVSERLGRGPRFPGALLLTGSSDAVLAREALALAAAMLCPGDDPERRCDACRRVVAGLHPDLLVVSPEGVQIRVDRVREAIAFAAGRPYEGIRRVSIVARAEQLGAEAGNALLKSLEEPGSRFHWILTTTRPEALLPTIRSRCELARVAPASAADRLAEWRGRGFSEADAPDLALLERQQEQARPEDLEQYRAFRGVVLEALESGLTRGNLPALILLAEELSRAEERARLLAELLADAAASGGVPADLLRHRAVSGALQKLARAAPREALERAALKAVDAPPDNRRGNRRLHYEAVLLDLFLARSLPS
jgi:DNA polymerase III subunit delta'